MLDLFRGLDENGDGNVSKKEFRKALPLLGLTEITRDTADLFFNTIDEDGSGSIQYSELSKKLRRKVTDTAGIQPTAAGKGGLRLARRVIQCLPDTFTSEFSFFPVQTKCP